MSKHRQVRLDKSVYGELAKLREAHPTFSITRLANIAMENGIPWLKRFLSGKEIGK